MNCIIFGDRSDIAQKLRPLLQADGWSVSGWNRDYWNRSVADPWDLLLIPIGTVKPVGPWWSQTDFDWNNAVYTNCLLPVEICRKHWRQRNHNAAVCFFAGANPNKPMENYSAYSVGKMALLKACEHLDLESPDCKFFALAPGTVLTKIHQPTLDAGVRNPVLERAMAKGQDIDKKVALIYECLKWCIAQPKHVIGGRNVCVSDMWEHSWYAKWLAGDPEMCKLRRKES